LLAYLVVENNRPHSREVLAELLWPEQPQRLALDNLRFALSDLRKAIQDPIAQPPFLIISRETLRFNPDCDFWLDVAEFERISFLDVPQKRGNNRVLNVDNLRDAIALYQGSFMEGFTASRSAPFEEWIALKREQLARQMIKTLHILGDYYERQGEIEQAMQCAWRQVELEPWQEEAHQQLMRLLTFDGQHSAALMQYEICCRTLSDELGVEPSSQTKALYESIRDGKLFIPSHFGETATPAFTETNETVRPVFVAREKELELLDHCLDQTLAGQGQVVFAVGEPGSGKTALLRNFLHHALTKIPNLVAAYGNCNAFTGVGDAYLPFIEILKMLSGDIEAQWAVGAIDRKQALQLWAAMPVVIQALIETGTGLIDRFIPGTELLARARAVSHVDTARLEDLLKREEAQRRLGPEPGAGERLQSELFEQYVRVLLKTSRQHPLMVILDDLQWVDIGSASLLFYLCRRLTGSQILVIGAYRPDEVALGQDGQLHPLSPVFHELQAKSKDNLIDLSQADGRHFIHAILDSEPNSLGNTFRETLYQHTGGLPLFTVELLRGLQERGDLIKDETGLWVENRTIEWKTLPPRIDTTIGKRVEGLPNDWVSVLSLGSVEGEEFTAEVVARILGVSEQKLVQELSGPLSKEHHMVQAVGLQRLGVEGRHVGQRLSRYRFRHQLFQRYLYSQLDRVERCQLHEAVGNTLEALYADQAGLIASTLARHFEAAGIISKAVEYFHQAGDNAGRMLAYQEAIAHYQHGLELLNTLPESPGRARQELKLRIAMGAPLISMHGFISRKLEETYTRARQLCTQFGDTADLFWVLSVLKSYYDVRAELRNSKDLGEHLLLLAQQENDPGMLMTAHSKMASLSVYLGRLSAFQEHLEQVNRLYDLERHRFIFYQVGADPKVMALCYGVMGFWFLGYAEKARQLSREVLALSKELGYPLMRWMAHYYSTYYYLLCENVKDSKNSIEILLRLCEEERLTRWLHYTKCLQGWLLSRIGDENGIPMLKKGTTQLKTSGEVMPRLQALRLLADACRMEGKASQSLETIEEALELIEKTGMVFEEPDLHRLKGEALLMIAPNRQGEAEACFNRAIDQAVCQEAKMWELKATMSLGWLWRQQGKLREAHQRLSDIYHWFTEGFDTTILVQARSLLTEIAKEIPV